MLFVVDAEAARSALHARAIRCPQEGCEGRLQPWSPARPRTVAARPGEQVRLIPDRGRCGVCRVSQTLLPAWYVPRRSCGIEVVGAAIGGFVNVGHRPDRIAATMGLPRSTVRRWLTGIADAAPVFADLARHIAVGIGATVIYPQSPKRPPCRPGTQNAAWALDQLAWAAHALTRPDIAYATRAPTGIDYIWLLGQRARRECNRRMRLVDPTNARPTLGIWPAINLAARGRLLNMINSMEWIT